jgi:hypothetical protein
MKRLKWPVVATMLSLAALYGAYPYVTLFRLGLAIKHADAATLQALVDWPAVREGIKEDVCDLGLADGPVRANSDGTLPPFGASFVRGIAGSAIDQAVTPEALVAATGAPTSGKEPSGTPPNGAPGADVHVNWAFFDSPTTFQVSLQPAGQADPIRLEMDLHEGEWRVQRVWLPAELLSNNGSRT